MSTLILGFIIAGVLMAIIRIMELKNDRKGYKPKQVPRGRKR